MELLGKYTLIGEGVRGSLAKQLIAKYKADAGCDVPKWHRLKELWEVKPENHKPGLVAAFLRLAARHEDRRRILLYHLEDNLVALVSSSPQLQEPVSSIRSRIPALQDASGDPRHFRGWKRLSYGARAITEGGLPVGAKLSFPAGR